MRALVSEGGITTTEAKAKYLKREMEKLTKLAKRGDLNARRMAISRMGNDVGVVKKLFEESGKITLSKLPPRRGDAALMTRVEWVKERDTRNVKRDKKKA